MSFPRRRESSGKPSESRFPPAREGRRLFPPSALRPSPSAFRFRTPRGLPLSRCAPATLSAFPPLSAFRFPLSCAPGASAVAVRPRHPFRLSSAFRFLAPRGLPLSRCAPATPVEFSAGRCHPICYARHRRCISYAWRKPPFGRGFCGRAGRNCSSAAGKTPILTVRQGRQAAQKLRSDARLCPLWI